MRPTGRLQINRSAPTGLAELGDRVSVRDVVLSDQVEILEDPEDIIAVASATREEQVIEAAPVEEEAAPEVIERGKTERGKKE